MTFAGLHSPPLVKMEFILKIEFVLLLHLPNVGVKGMLHHHPVVWFGVLRTNTEDTMFGHRT